MKQLQFYGVKELNMNQKIKTDGGNPIRVALGLISAVISIGKAVDQASEWFLDGWNNPN